jgi:hypothetical protein
MGVVHGDMVNLVGEHNPVVGLITNPGRHGSDSDGGPRICVSIHAPRTGGDLYNFQRKKDQGVSIHAPRTGGDGETT